ncbi:RNA-binding protein 34-like [Penaeus japonicus]|uniref:RNA-binding protein 34-like n=1 Tax=Penaeus japonicus TaxID=27405 RepID=UPI001C70EBB8|nr:RNA-binding protein 34-like [Penaeus japonicus]
MDVSSDAENAQHDSPAQNEKIPDASGDKEMANEKQTPDTSKEGTMKTNMEGTPSGGMRTKKALFVKKLKKMLEADAKLVTAQASNKSKAEKPEEKKSTEAENKKVANESQMPSFEKERNNKFKKILEADGSFTPLQANKSKFKKPQEKYSAETETKKRANENQTPFFETGRNKKFKQMSEAGDSFIPLQRNKGVNEQSTKMEVVEGKETNTKSNKIQIWKEDSQVEGDSVFVGNIDLKAKRKDLLKFFKPYGEVDGVRICSLDKAHPLDRKKAASFKESFQLPQSSPCAYVRFKNTESVTTALDANDKIFRGNRILVFSACGNRIISFKSSVFVGNVPYDANEEEIEEVFQKCGAIESVRIFRDSDPDAERTIAYVNFKTPEAIPLAIRKNNAKLRGQRLRVQRYSMRVQMEKDRRKKVVIQQKKETIKQKREERALLPKPKMKKKKKFAGRRTWERGDRRPSGYGNKPFSGGRFNANDRMTMGGNRRNFADDRRNMLPDVNSTAHMNKPKMHIRFDEGNNMMRPKPAGDFHPMPQSSNMAKPKLHIKFDD